MLILGLMRNKHYSNEIFIRFQGEFHVTEIGLKL